MVRQRQSTTDTKSECHGFVNRADVAAHIHELANAPALNQQVYSLIEPDLKPA